MVRVFAAILLLSVSLDSSADGIECATYEVSAEQLGRIRSLVGGAIPADAELSNACKTASGVFAPTVDGTERSTSLYTFIWLVQSGANGTRFYQESTCELFPTERVSCYKSGRLARTVDNLAIRIDDTITDFDLESVLDFSRRALGDARRVSGVWGGPRRFRERGADSESEFTITFDRTQGQAANETYHVTRVCNTPVETLEQCRWKLDGPYWMID